MDNRIELQPLNLQVGDIDHVVNTNRDLIYGGGGTEEAALLGLEAQAPHRTDMDRDVLFRRLANPASTAAVRSHQQIANLVAQALDRNQIQQRLVSRFKATSRLIRLKCFIIPVLIFSSFFAVVCLDPTKKPIWALPVVALSFSITAIRASSMVFCCFHRRFRQAAVEALQHPEAEFAEAVFPDITDPGIQAMAFLNKVNTDRGANSFELLIGRSVHDGQPLEV